MNYEEARKKFVDTIVKGTNRFRPWEVFTDFCHMGAISLYQPLKKSQELEAEYLKIVGKYSKEEAQIFPELLSLVVIALSDRMGDFLGECFTDLDLGSKYKGQFFTPYPIAKFMALSLGESGKEIEKTSDPACGSGCMLIARADSLQGMKINYQKRMLVQAVDIDSLCVSMCYIQLSLLHIPAEVIHGDSLTLEVYKRWYTPAYIMSGNSLYPKNEKDNSSSEDNSKKESYTKEQLKNFSKGTLF
ncbi:MAG: Unknown protein [uncultured Campylobacterales bacterium]|uniref:site-specific DNA-methyltransferase (adenine-specific) n=1 Tax=uncultured Campylobacterales bacterium TaxID=352960 RepID=A0A6S6T2Y3_9BACT|nr:MAG: Unknown protein [uncultured Campylobacterales bacterium]